MQKAICQYISSIQQLNKNFSVFSQSLRKIYIKLQGKEKMFQKKAGFVKQLSFLFPYCFFANCFQMAIFAMPGIQRQ